MTGREAVAKKVYFTIVCDWISFISGFVFNRHVLVAMLLTFAVLLTSSTTTRLVFRIDEGRTGHCGDANTNDIR